MRGIAFNPCFVNEAGNDLIPGKIHTIRQNYEYWKRYEGKEVALFTWEGKPYRSKQKIFCVKRIVSVQVIKFVVDSDIPAFWFEFNGEKIKLSKNDGFEKYSDFITWFTKGVLQGYYKRNSEMAILHFTDFRYGGNHDVSLRV